ncbi:MAG: 2-dehydropantoate 2-reductase N-terminal domain-containing protein, partial [Thermoplasmatota archaeon]
MQASGVVMMKIMVFGAGAIGSLFGGLLSTKNEVLLFGRKNQMTAI